MTTTLTVEGMSCDGSEQKVEEALKELSGVTDASADHETDQARVDGETGVTALVEAVEDAGYTAEV